MRGSTLPFLDLGLETDVILLRCGPTARRVSTPPTTAPSAHERRVRVELKRPGGWGEPQNGHPLRQELERDAGLQPGQRSPETEVNGVTERHLLVGVLAACVELVRRFRDALTPVMLGNRNYLYWAPSRMVWRSSCPAGGSTQPSSIK